MGILFAMSFANLSMLLVVPLRIFLTAFSNRVCGIVATFNGGSINE